MNAQFTMHHVHTSCHPFPPSFPPSPPCFLHITPPSQPPDCPKVAFFLYLSPSILPFFLQFSHFFCTNQKKKFLHFPPIFPKLSHISPVGSGNGRFWALNTWGCNEIFRAFAGFHWPMNGPVNGAPRPHPLAPLPFFGALLSFPLPFLTATSPDPIPANRRGNCPRAARIGCPM